MAFGNAIAEVREPWRRALTAAREESEPEVADLEELWEWVIDQTDSFLLSYAPSERAHSLLEWLGLVAAHPAKALRDRPKGDERALPADAEVAMWLQLGISFALAHELGHHLLNHLDPQVDVAELGVGDRVTSWLSSIGIERPTDLNRSQSQEWMADAFALFVLIGQPDATVDDFWRVTLLAGGAACATLALFIAGEVLAESGMESRSHPPIEVRLKLVMEVTIQVGRGLPQPPPMRMANGRTVEPEAGLYALQLFGAAQTLLGQHAIHGIRPSA